VSHPVPPSFVEYACATAESVTMQAEPVTQETPAI
jgi:hypothetical protein